MNKRTDLQIAHEAAIKASTVIKHYASNRDKLNIELKGKHDLVTQADVETEQKIVEIIQHYCPDDVILGEETASHQRLSNARTWIIDSIDGTTNFAHAFPVFCISIALWENMEPKAAVIFEINSGEVFTAEKGGGAFLNGKLLHISEVNKPENALLGTGFPYRDLEIIDDYLALFKCFMKETHGVRRPGSAAYDLACVAAGRLDGFYEYALSPWDVAAGVLLIQEAGGMVVDWNGGDEWLFGKRIVCGNKAMTGYLLERIKTYIPSELRESKPIS